MFLVAPHKGAKHIEARKGRFKEIINLESEQQQEGHHKTEKSHSFRQGEAQNGVWEQLLFEWWVSGVANDEWTEHCSDTSTCDEGGNWRGKKRKIESWLINFANFFLSMTTKWKWNFLEDSWVFSWNEENIMQQLFYRAKSIKKAIMRQKSPMASASAKPRIA